MENKLKIGFIGLGSRGKDLFEMIVELKDFKIIAVCENNPERIEYVKKELPLENVHLYTDYLDMLDKEDLDGVISLTQCFTHEDIYISLLNKNIPSYIEKPIATTTRGADRILKLARKKKVPMLVGFVLREAVMFRKFKELMDSGIIGKPLSVWVLHSVRLASPSYFHRWMSLYKNTGGLITQKACHDFDVLRWFMESRISEVSAYGTHSYFGGNKPNNLKCTDCPQLNSCIEAPADINKYSYVCCWRKEIDVTDNHVVNMKFENGIVGSYLECHFTPDDNREYIVTGSKGKLILDERNKLIHILKRKRSAELDEEKIKVDVVEDKSLIAGHGGGDLGIFGKFAEMLRTNKTPVPGILEGRDAVAVANTAHESIRKNRPVTVPYI